jgi:3-oxoadipate enol-lactonase
MPYAAVNGQRIWFEDSGGEGPVIILSHGFLMDRSMFDHQVVGLREKYRLITWDSRGFGRTEYDGQPFNYWDLADDCVGVLDSLGIDRAIVGGMSQGGFVSLRVALRYPERVQALILIDTQAGAEHPDHVSLYQGMFDAWAEHGADDDMAYTAASIIIADPFENMRWIPKWKARAKESIVEPGRCLLTRDDISEQVKSITCPAMIVHGLADAAISIDLAQHLRNLLPGFQQMSIIESAGHAANLTHPEVTNRAMKEFLLTLTA